MFSGFSGIDIQVVEAGHQLRDPKTGTVWYVQPGNPVQGGRVIFMVQSDFEMLRNRLTPEAPQ